MLFIYFYQFILIDNILCTQLENNEVIVILNSFSCLKLQLILGILSFQYLLHYSLFIEIWVTRDSLTTLQSLFWKDLSKTIFFVRMKRVGQSKRMPEAAVCSVSELKCKAVT